MKIGSQIKEIRKKKGIKQYELAESVGISKSYLSQVEKDLRNPSTECLEAISFKLSIPLSILFFKSIEESDIDEKKKDVFNILHPVIDNLVNQLIG